jgi:DNA-binding NarL/FixJ family response regulator
MRVRIAIVDDDRLVCAALKTIVEAGGVEVAGTGHSGEEAVEIYARLQPDILLMDIRMGGMTGLEAGECILAAHPEAKLLFLTTFSDDEYIVKALKIGAKGYLLKQNFDSIVPALTSVHLGQSIFGDAIVSRLPGLIGSAKADTVADLTEREHEVLTLIAEGLSNKEIAARLFLSEGTVRNNISVLLEKLALRDRTQLAIYYYRHMI